jgi:arabinan endo-1,5-alpha-L-arabinosidase
VHKNQEVRQMKYPFHIRNINISDPFILADPVSRKYYTYARRFNIDLFPWQKEGGTFYALESEDLINWSEPRLVFERKDFWADLDYWAPECHIWNGKYYIISSFRAKGTYRRCQCLVSDSPLGPFKPISEEPVTPKGWQCLDGTLYVDKRGKPWMVFCHEWLQVYDGQIAAVPLSDDLGEAIGPPVILFRASDAPWRDKFIGENGGGYVTDGPFLYRMKDGTLIMLWSNFTPHGYATGYAKSLSGELTGPWVQETEPLYAHDGAHSMLFHTFEGQLMMALHCPNIHPLKRILLFEMEEKDGKLHVINEVTGNWYNSIRGLAKNYRYKDPCIEEPAFTKRMEKSK